MRSGVCAVPEQRFKRLVSARIRRGKRLGYMMLVCEINRSKAQDSHWKSSTAGCEQRHGWSDEAVPGAITNCMQLESLFAELHAIGDLDAGFLVRKRGSCGRRAMIGIPPAVISIAGKPICRRVERLVSHWCAAELRARLGVKRATGQPGSGVVVPSLVR
jgi:hypothetical protein